jgi:hypothetical protein
MMASTHAAYGFVSSYVLALLFVRFISPTAYPLIMSVTAWLVIVGMIGGVFPDLDQLQFWGPPWISKHFRHKDTCHYIAGYVLAAMILLATAVLVPSYALWLLGLACAAFGAGIHSLMDPLDGWNDNNPAWGIYEHVTKRWLPSLRWVMFAGLWEWIIQAFATIWFIWISANLSPLTISAWQFPGWLVATGSYGSIWVISTLWDARHAPERQERERELIHAIRKVK